MKISSKKRVVLLIILTILVVVVMVSALFITGLITIPRSTEIIVTPSSFVIESGKTITLTARLQSDSFILTGKTIYWSASEGSFDRTVGETVTYTAPNVLENKTLTITVSFPGDKDYQGSKKIITGIIMPRKAITTVLIINPSTFEVEAGKTFTLNAILTPFSAPSDIISWSLEGPGLLSSTSGSITNYIAPQEIKEKTSVKIIAVFPGTSEYLKSTAESIGTIHPIGVISKKATIIVVDPPMFRISSGGNIELSATLKDSEGNIITNRPFSWILEGPGTLSSTTGVKTTYVAPSDVKEKLTIKITVIFEGDENYAPSKSIIIGEVEPLKIKIEEIAYTLTFGEAILKDVKIEGPMSLYGVEVVRISAGSITIKTFSLSRLGLTALTVQMSGAQWYVTELTAYSPELKETFILKGGDKISTSYNTLTLEKGLSSILKLVAELVEFEDVEVLGEYVGGEEPYIPTIMNVPIGKLTEGYSITKSSWKELTEKVHLFTFGRAEIKDFSLYHPAKYYLDRVRNTFTFENRWVIRASEGIFINGTAYPIFINFKAFNLGPFIFSGEDLPFLMGMERGEGGPISEGVIHVVYGKVEKIIVKESVMDIILQS